MEKDLSKEEKQNIYYSEVKIKIIKIFEDEFSKRGFNLEDTFNYNVWFLNQYAKTSSLNNFKEILSSTPSETDDIIKHLIVKSFIRCRNSEFKIETEAFIEEISDIIIFLQKEMKRINKLIKKYNAYDTVNTLEMTLDNFENINFTNEAPKSFMKFFIRGAEGFPRGDYKISLLGAFLNVNKNVDILEHKLNSVMRIHDSESLNSFQEGELVFKPVEFFSFENSVKNVNDSGTNFCYFFIKCENLNSNNNSVGYSPQKRVLDVILANMKTLLNNYKKNKVLDTNIEFEFQEENVNVDMGINIDLDAMTCSSIYSKAMTLLKELISYKVKTMHKWKTIMNYFEDVSDDITYSFMDKNKRKDYKYKESSFDIFMDSEEEEKLESEENGKHEKKKSCTIF